MLQYLIEQARARRLCMTCHPWLARDVAPALRRRLRAL
jgi:hypothetical protein